jgi:competence protein ComEC
VGLHLFFPLVGLGTAGLLAVRRLPAAQPLWMRSGAVVLLWCSAGSLTENLHHRRYAASPLVASAEIRQLVAARVPLLLRGRIVDDPVAIRDRLQTLLQVEQVWRKGRWRPAPGKIRLSIRDPSRQAPIRFGERIEVSARLRQPRNFGNPGAFDYRRHLEGEGIHLLGTVKSPRLVRRLATPRWSPGSFLHRLRSRLLRRLSRPFPGRPGQECRRYLQAILLGERRSEEAPFDGLFRQTGVYHILSISGLHFSLLLAGLHRLTRRLPGGRWLAPTVQGGTAALYVILSGGEDPILRSALASLLAAFGKACGRRISSWDCQAVAAIPLLAAHPLHIFDPGFQLSFVASWGLLAGSGDWWGRLRRLPLVGRLLAASTSAWIASMPILAACFLQISPVALLLNLLAAPFLSLSLLLGAAVLVVPAAPVAHLTRILLDGFSALCSLSLKIPGACLRIAPPAPLVLFAFVSLATVRLVRGPAAPRREARLLGIFLLAASVGIANSPVTDLPPGRIELVALDVGQGDSLLLRLPGRHAILVDAGGFANTDFDVGEKVVVPALLALGVRRLDVVVLTHAHQDHGGGMPAVLANFPPGELWIGRAPDRVPLLAHIAETIRGSSVSVAHPTRGALRCFGSACLQVLHPPVGYRQGAPVSNDDSLVLRLTFGETSLLLTGDIERNGEETLLASGSPLRSGLLKVAHHGSASSTSERCLERVSPRSAVVSVGDGNTWGHPSRKVLERLSSRGVEILRTDRDGAIRYASDGERWRRVRPVE